MKHCDQIIRGLGLGLRGLSPIEMLLSPEIQAALLRLALSEVERQHYCPAQLLLAGAEFRGHSEPRAGSG